MVEYIKFKEEEKDDKKNSNKKKKYTISFKKIFYLTIFIILLTFIISTFTVLISPKIAVIPIKGPIITEASTSIYGKSVSSRSIASTIYQLKNDDSVKAILLDINSPGGSPVASEEISKAIKDTKKIKPVYALINDMGASGAFWVAVSTDKIYASSMSTLGSIGVTSAGLSFEDFIKAHNITYRKLTSGEIKDIGTPFRKQTPKEKEIIQNMLDNIHQKFIKHVAISRNISIQNVTKYANGEIFLGDYAKEIGFIDEIGYYPDVIQALKNITNNPDLITVTYGENPTLLQIIGINTMLNFGDKSLVMLN